MSRHQFALIFVSVILFVVSGYAVWSSFQNQPSTFGQSPALSSGWAALFGATIGGAVTIGAQIISARVQVKLQASRDKTERELADDRWRRDTHSRTRESLHPDVRELLEEVVTVHREVEAAKPTMAQAMGSSSWKKEWKEIWSEPRSLKFDVYRELILDKEAKKALGRIGSLLDGVDSITDPAFPRRITNPSLRTLGMMLLGSAIHVLAQYLRSENYLARDDEKQWKKLEETLADYQEWEEHEYEQAQLNAEKMQNEAASEQDAAEQAEHDEREHRHYEELDASEDPAES